MRLYYRGPDALITAGQFVWLGETPRVYAIADLRGARLTRHSPKNILLPAAFAAVLIRGRAERRFELRADELIIYSTMDERTFNQVARALQRVMESYSVVRFHTGSIAA
ncbi:hypothetical protein HH310_39070 [Actinoplanes sp. TBRC 11911]|uniref:hypothetical protein n=1 Tax=Actinoplanes sp. TBRC 11911 TaxID=2729386 RepID=UPI00145EB4C8|nr:hypothetical protein [Actinoplanes sp. TBRC 11911]NMO57163.1 hypothetical protein [Actinoplanes sp. TBRC 11911]